MYGTSWISLKENQVLLHAAIHTIYNTLGTESAEMNAVQFILYVWKLLSSSGCALFEFQEFCFSTVEYLLELHLQNYS